MALSQQPFPRVRVVARTDGDPLSLASPVAGVLREVDRELPMADVRTLDDVAAEALGERRFALWLFQAFAVLALALAAFGIYGMLSYLVQQRRRELGVRMALGASRARVVSMVVRDGAIVCGAGILLGLLAVPPAARALSALLFGVTGYDPFSLAVAPVVIAAAGLLACAVPAWAASRSETAVVLRE
jgi:predicted lysophospholipase L1 biosynthesis ABC-type transport system permease subunit